MEKAFFEAMGKAGTQINTALAPGIDIVTSIVRVFLATVYFFKAQPKGCKVSPSLLL